MYMTTVIDNAFIVAMKVFMRNIPGDEIIISYCGLLNLLQLTKLVWSVETDTDSIATSASGAS